MSHVISNNLNGAARVLVKGSALVMLASLALGSASAYAQSYNDGYFIRQSGRQEVRGGRLCRPANGGEIRGAFAGADDYIDVRTGDICPR